jgi:choice-of-anchor A domain-containing protein
MFRKITRAAALTAGLVAMPALAAGDAATGMAAMSNWNLIVLGNWEAAHDVEGRAIVAGNATGGSVTVGIGRSAAGQSGTVTTDPTLVIGGNNKIGALNVDNGPNGGLGKVATAASVWVGGNSNSGGSINLNGGGATNLLVGGNYNATTNSVFNAQIGGNMTNGTLTPANSGASISLGGQKTGGNMNLNGASYQQNLGAGFKSGLEGAVAGMTSDLSDNLHALSSTLSGLSIASNPSFLSSSGQTLVLNAVKGANAFSVFNLTQADLVGFTSIAYNFTPDAGPVVINFLGQTLTSGPNIGKVEAKLSLNFTNPSGTDDFKAVNQSVVWNFGTADFVHFGTEFFGSVLAADALVSNVNAINGSVVAKTFKQGGEVHLGTFNGFDIPQTPPPPVPEPGTWAMMILGFGSVGAFLRRRVARAQIA